MTMWEKMFRKKDEAPPAPAKAQRPEPPPPMPEAPNVPDAKRETGTRKKQGSGTKKRDNSTSRIVPVDAKAFTRRGLARQAKDDHDGAIADFTKAIELDPNAPQAYAARGVSRERKGDLAGAKADYGKSIQIEIMAEISRQLAKQPDE